MQKVRCRSTSKTKSLFGRGRLPADDDFSEIYLDLTPLLDERTNTFKIRSINISAQNITYIMWVQFR